MKLKVLGITVGVLLTVAIIGVGTIWAQSGVVTPAPASPAAPAAPAQNASCDQFMQALATHLGVTVDKLTQASKDASKDLIDQAVKDGRLTQDQANQAKQRIDQAQGACAFGHFGGFGRGPFGGQPPAGGFPPAGGPRGPRGQRPGQVITGTRNIDGATLTQVVADSPAAKAGLQTGDVILAVGGQNIDAQHLLDMLIRQHKPGDTIEIKYQRGSNTQTANVTLGAQPNNAAVPFLGVQFQYRRSPA